ncbi:MAG: hypothetical protein IBX50_19765 [Marinospirillum sp.]|uniref:hypothetical protein n=1 Tax=Marinospirillum sp. TaxID=2183934 RepID=UPI001A04883E|nr:hypothetical protein [Marinospirillum sp.]MBE0508925.1 hypothetical protein [Marinospirillum sp.]
MKNNTIGRIRVSPYARIFGRRLIQRLQVRRGYGIAEYLGIEHFYTNYEAVYLWVDQVLNTNNLEILTDEFIQAAFINALPIEVRGSID